MYCGSVLSRSVFQLEGWQFNPHLGDVSLSKTLHPDFPVAVSRECNMIVNLFG